MKKKYLLMSFLLWLGLFIQLSVCNAYAAESKPKNISTDQNGTIKIELYDSSNMIYKIVITPNEGYSINEVKLYYSNIDDFYQEINLFRFEDGKNGEKIWYYHNNQNYNRQDIEVTFRKTGNEGTLILTAIKNEVSYGEDILIQVQLKDAKEKNINISQKGELNLFAPLETEDYYNGFSKEAYSISDKNIINIDSTSLNGTTDLVFSGYYKDNNTGFVTDISKVKVKINSIKPTIKLEDSTQIEGHVVPLTASSTPCFYNVGVYYKVRKNNTYQWIREVPQWPGTYEVEAVLPNLGVSEATEVTATLTVIEDDSPDTYKSTSYISTYDTANYVKANIKDNVLYIDGTYQNGSSAGYTLLYGLYGEDIASTGENNSFSITKNINDLLPGAYDIMLWSNADKSNNINSHLVLDLLLIKEKDEAYFLESQVLEINRNAIANMSTEDLDNNSVNLSEPQYTTIVDKAKEITKDVASDYDKIHLIYLWIAESIYYNEDQYYYHKNTTEQDAVSVFNSKIAVCEGYSRLFHVMLESVGIKDVIVFANARIDGDYRFGIEKNEGHAWNMAYCSEKKRWVIIDTTWGSLNKYVDKKFIYRGSNILYFDCSLQSISKNHAYNIPEVTSEVPNFIDPYTIKVGDTILLLDNDILEYSKMQISFLPGNILRSEKGFNVKALSVGICYVSMNLTTISGEIYSKNFTITVIDPEFVNGLTDVNNIGVDEDNRGFLEKCEKKYYSFRTNSDTEAYVFRFNNLSQKDTIYCEVYDGNGIMLDSGNCSSNENCFLQ